MKLQYEVMLVVIFEPDYGFFVPTAGLFQWDKEENKWVTRKRLYYINRILNVSFRCGGPGRDINRNGASNVPADMSQKEFLNQVLASNWDEKDTEARRMDKALTYKRKSFLSPKE